MKGDDSHLGVFEMSSVEQGLDSFFAAPKGQIGTD